MMPFDAKMSPYDIDAKGKPKARHHPAFNYTLITILLLGLTIMFGFITVFIPWAQVDIGVGQRAWAYPFKTCIENTFSNVNEETCIDNDFIEPGGAGVTGRTKKCMGFILATIAFVFLYVLIGAITLVVIVVGFVHLWRRPVLLFFIIEILLIVVFWCALIAFVMFICYAEDECVPNSFFPVHGYSYGFIMTVFASAMALAACVTGFLSWRTIKKFQPGDNYLPVAEQAYPQQSFMPMPTSPYPSNFAFSESQVVTTTPVMPPVFL